MNDSFNAATFCMRDNCHALVHLVHLESHYLNVKVWHSKFFVVTRRDWEYPTGDDVFKDFLVKVIWDLIPLEKSLWAHMGPLTR